MLSAKDVALVESWERAHIPLHIVLRALERAMEHAPETVRGLNYVRKAVEEEASTWRRSQQGAPVTFIAKPTDFSSVFENLISQFEIAAMSAKTPALKAMCQLVIENLKKLDPATPEMLAKLREYVISWSEHNLESEVERDLNREVDLALRNFALQGPEIRRALRWKKLRVYAGCPDLVMPLGEK